MREILGRLKYYAAMVLFLLTSSILSIGPAFLAGTASAGTPPPPATSPLYFTGQGIPVDQKCSAKDDPLGANAPYLLFIFTYGGNYNPTDVALHGISTTSQIENGNETHIITPYEDPVTLENVVNVTWAGTVGNAGLKISHGCAGTPTPPVLIPVTPVVNATTPTCEVPSETVTPVATDGVTWAPTDAPTVLAPGASVTYVATIDTADYVLTQGAQTSFPFTNNFDINTCNQSVRPARVTFKDVCGTANDVYTIPSTAGVTYQIGGKTVSSGSYPGSGTVTVMAVAQQGFVLVGNATWSHTFTDKPCHLPPPKVTLCHATDSWKNPYVEITVSAAGAYHGHYLQHTGPVFSDSQAKGTKWGDIIPTFTYHSNQYSLNWTAEGQEIFNKGCQVPAPPTKVRPARVTFTNPTCENPTLGQEIIPDEAGVVYKDANGTVLTPGTHDVTVKGTTTVTITAYPANNNIVLKGGTVWTHTFTEANGCGGGGPINPNITVTAGACVSTSLPTGTATVTVNNPNNFDVDFRIDLGTQEQSLTVGAGQTGQVTFTGLAAGTYSVTVRGNDDTVSAEGSVTIANCPVTPPTTPPTGGKGGGQVLGASTSVTTPSAVSELANTGTSTVLPTILAISMSLTAAGVMYGSRQRRNLSSHIDADLE